MTVKTYFTTFHVERKEISAFDIFQKYLLSSCVIEDQETFAECSCLPVSDFTKLFCSVPQRLSVSCWKFTQSVVTFEPLIFFPKVFRGSTKK